MLTSALTGRADRERLARLTIADAGHGFDEFGLEPGGVATAVALLRFAYAHYFRVASYDAAYIPATGPVVIAANHGGMLPVDAAMLYLDVLTHTDPPRVPRPVADGFVPFFPIIGTLFARGGVIAGSRENVHRLLERNELLLIFPEGVGGIGKSAAQRYELQTWSVGHAELAIRHRAPVVPVGIVGPDEQWPELFRLSGFHLFGAPYLPIPALPLPLPVRYHIRYGQPLCLHEGLAPSDADDPAIVRAAANRVQDAVAALIAESLRARRGVFR
jgi:1-acyl-sn-glycerol-3-phosphate acyltransferase